MNSKRSTLLSTHFDFEQLVRNAVNTALSVTLSSQMDTHHVMYVSSTDSHSVQWKIDDDPDPLHWTDVN